VFCQDHNETLKQQINNKSIRLNSCGITSLLLSYFTNYTDTSALLENTPLVKFIRIYIRHIFRIHLVQEKFTEADIKHFTDSKMLKTQKGGKNVMWLKTIQFHQSKPKERNPSRRAALHITSVPSIRLCSLYMLFAGREVRVGKNFARGLIFFCGKLLYKKYLY